MYKTILNILAIVSLAILATNCDGRQTQKQALDKAISEFNKKEQATTIVKYVPERYTEIQTDTIIENDFQVKITNKSLMNTNILSSESTVDNRKTTLYHRIFQSEIKVYHKNKMVFDQTLSAKRLQRQFPELINDQTTLEHTWVVLEESSKDLATIAISFLNPKTDDHKLLKLSIGSKGDITINSEII